MDRADNIRHEKGDVIYIQLMETGTQTHFFAFPLAN